MNKKATWGIIALVAVVVIAGIVFMVDREKNGEGQSDQQAEQMDQDLVWEAEDKLLAAHKKINDMQEFITEEEYEDLRNKHNEIEDALYEMEDAYFNDKLSEEGYKEGLENITQKIEIFINEMETDGENVKE